MILFMVEVGIAQGFNLFFLKELTRLSVIG